jgi:hypothetical protein
MFNAVTHLPYVAMFDTQDQAIEHCKAMNRGQTEPMYAVIDGPENNYAVVDLEVAKEILDWPDSGIPWLIATD